MGDLTTGYLLGQMAERHFREMEETAVAVMAPRRVAQPQINVQALIAENQALRSENAYLRECFATLQADIERLRAWGRGLYNELVQIKGH